MTVNSKYHHITNHTQLMHTIMHVNASRVQQETDIKHQLKEIYYSIQPAALMKKAMGSVIDSPEIRKNVAQSAMSLGAEFLIGKLFRRGSSLKGFISSLVVEKVAEYALNKQPDLLKNGLGKLGDLFKQFKK